MPPLRPIPLRLSTLPIRSLTRPAQIAQISLSSTPNNSPPQPVTVPINTSIISRPLATTAIQRAQQHEEHHGSGGHDSHYDPPSGWLWGIPPGEKYKKEGWEGIWVYGYWGSLILGVVLYAYKPDTSIQTWALEEARRRLEKEGILEDPFPENGEKPKPRRYYEAREDGK